MRKLLPLLALLFGACSESTEPTPVYVEGRFALSAVNGSPLPVTLAVNGNIVTQLLADTVRFSGPPFSREYYTRTATGPNDPIAIMGHESSGGVVSAIRGDTLVIEQSFGIDWGGERRAWLLRGDQLTIVYVSGRSATFARVR